MKQTTVVVTVEQAIVVSIHMCEGKGSVFSTDQGLYYVGERSEE